MANMTLDGLEAAIDASVAPTGHMQKVQADMRIFCRDSCIEGNYRTQRSLGDPAIHGRSRFGALGRKNQDHPH